MALMETPFANAQFKAPDFSLQGIDGKTYTLADVRGEKGTLVMFICNHCPYVKGITDRLASTMAELQQNGIGVVAIMSNDTQAYPADSFDNMKLFAKENGFTFPYVIDETQQAAKAYGAVCTPDFFGFDAGLQLQYRGWLDSSGKNPTAPTTVPELKNAMLEIAAGKPISAPQVPSMGCSIKWR